MAELYRKRYNGVDAVTLGAAISSSGATSITFAAALQSMGANIATLGTDEYLPLVIDNEIIYLTAYTAAATTGTISRGKEGTTAATHSNGASVVHGPTVADVSGQSPFEIALLAFGCSPLIMVDNTSAGHLSVPATMTPMVTGHPRPPGGFDGRFDDITIPDNAILDASTFSIVIGFSMAPRSAQLTSRWSDVTGDKAWSMDTSGTSNKVRFLVLDTSAVSTTALSTGTAVDNGAKHLVIGTFDGSKVARLYVDADTVVVTSAMSGTPKNAASGSDISVGGTRATDIIENNAGDAFKGNIGVFAYLPGVVLSGANVATLYGLF